jgi:hypothetical protein
MDVQIMGARVTPTNKRDWGRLQYLVLALCGAIFSMTGARVDRELSLREKATFGTILLHEPRNHNRYGYKFEVSGREYSGWESPLKDEPGIGSTVTVYHDPLNPSESALTDFSERGQREAAIASALFALERCGHRCDIVLRPAPGWKR